MLLPQVEKRRVDRRNTCCFDRKNQDWDWEKPTPSAGIIDSQSVKACNICEGDIGFDGGKRIKGRKRHIVVDTLGLVMIIVIHAANTHESVGARVVMRSLKDKYLCGIVKIFADGG